MLIHWLLKIIFHLLTELQKLPLATLQNIYSLLGDESQGLTSLWGKSYVLS